MAGYRISGGFAGYRISGRISASQKAGYRISGNPAKVNIRPDNIRPPDIRPNPNLLVGYNIQKQDRTKNMQAYLKYVPNLKQRKHIIYTGVNLLYYNIDNRLGINVDYL